MSEPIWVIRVDVAQGEAGHPEFLGPYTRIEAAAVMGRLSAAGRSYEVAALVTEADLPGLYRPPPRG